MDDLIVSIHQPNLMPWLGYFNKIAKSDAFVLLDDVQIQKTGASYTNRVDIGLDGAAHPVTAPIVRSSGTTSIRETRFTDGRWKDKTIKTLQSAYAKAAAYKAHADWLFELVAYPGLSLAEYNTHFIVSVARALGIDTPIQSASDMDVNATDPTERLIALVRKLGGTMYLSGKGGANYQDAERFALAGIELHYTDNSGLAYAQSHRPQPLNGLSIVDAIFCIGVPATSELLARPHRNHE